MDNYMDENIPNLVNNANRMLREKALTTTRNCEWIVLCDIKLMNVWLVCFDLHVNL